LTLSLPRLTVPDSETEQQIAPQPLRLLATKFVPDTDRTVDGGAPLGDIPI